MLESLFATANPAAMPHLPLAFSLGEEKALHLPLGYETIPTWRLLSHHVRRYPLDLRAHAQRIILVVERPLEAFIEGSLLDLFLALGNSGALLKRRMLELAKPQLSAGSYQFFSENIEANTDHLKYTWFEGSMLATGLTSKPIPLLQINRPSHAQDYASLLEEVQACLEYGQVEQAQTLLEQELLAGRTDEALQHELLSIYQSTRDKTAFNNLLMSMEAQGMEMISRWKDLQIEAQRW